MQPVKSKMLLQYGFEVATAGSQILKQNRSEPMKLLHHTHTKSVSPRVSLYPVRMTDVCSGLKNVLVPFNNLLERVVIAVVARERIGVDKGAERVTTLFMLQVKGTLHEM